MRAEADRAEDPARRAVWPDVRLAVGVARRQDGAGQVARRGTRPELLAELVRVAGAAELIDVAIILIVAADADVVREHAVGRRAAGLDVGAVIEDRDADAEIRGGVAGKRSGLDHLIDETGESLRLGVGRRRAGVDLQLELPERRERARRIVVERAIDRNAVELVTDLRRVAAAYVHRLQVAVLIRGHVGAGDRRDRRVRAVERAAAAEYRRRVLPAPR